MNKSNFVHAAFAVMFQVIVFAIGCMFGPLAAGGAAGVLFFLGREHDQRQHQIQLSTGVSIKEQEPWSGMDMAKWSLDSRLDLIFPVIAVVLVALAAYLLGWSAP